MAELTQEQLDEIQRQQDVVASHPSSLFSDLAPEFGGKLRSSATEAASIELSEQERQLLDLVSKGGIQELEKLLSGDAFKIGEDEERELKQISALRRDEAEGGLQFALETAGRQAGGAAAARGLARGSGRAEIFSRLADPAIQRFQSQVADIGSEEGRLRLALPRQDIGLRQSILQSPALTAQQRNRLATAGLRLQLKGQNFAQKQAEDAQSGGIFSDIFSAGAQAIDLISPGTPANADGGRVDFD